MIDGTAIFKKLAEEVTSDYARRVKDPKFKGGEREREAFLQADLALRLASKSLAMLQKIERRLETLEGCGIKYAGVYQRAQDYTRGQVVTHHGSAWVAIADTTRAEPGTTSGWQLMVKAGRDAK